jgi:hypothetical protein
LIIDWLKEVASVTAVARLLGLSWHEVDGVQRRAVRHLGGLDLYPAGISGATHTRP